ncbi:serine proteinase stubble [Caerostris extrusa]|uniref:Serine proteinase stubble n=1 Tax=Caerostris extrusa TaxID=172846 RepID=A0AAV4UFN8_CAEEX|nr:serine proteinase stubble [Caerostris extrusa]
MFVSRRRYLRLSFQSTTVIHLAHKTSEKFCSHFQRPVNTQTTPYCLLVDRDSVITCGPFFTSVCVEVGVGGALVAWRHVVTAGHCVAKTQHNPGAIKVTLGDYILNSDLEGLPSETFGVDEVKVHPKFRFTPQADRFDVAVLLR